MSWDQVKVWATIAFEKTTKWSPKIFRSKLTIALVRSRKLISVSPGATLNESISWVGVLGM